MWDRHSTTSDAYEIWMVFRVTRKPPLTSVRFYSGFRALLNFLFCCAQAIPKLILQVDIHPVPEKSIVGLPVVVDQYTQGFRAAGEEPSPQHSRSMHSSDAATTIAVRLLH